MCVCVCVCGWVGGWVGGCMKGRSVYEFVYGPVPVNLFVCVCV